jgi:DNA replication protein DnaC
MAARCWRYSGAPERHKNQCQDLRGNLDWFDARDAVLEAVDNSGMVALIGSPGAGKTQIGVLAIRHVCLTLYKPCRYESMGDLFALIRTAYGPSATKSEMDVIGEFVTPHLLVIDEIDKRAGTENESRLLHRILDKRYRAMKPTLLIGNVATPQALKLLLDGPGEGIGPLFDRLRETGGIVEAFGWSFREGGAK